MICSRIHATTPEPPPPSPALCSTAAARCGHERLLLRLLEARPGTLPATEPGADGPLIWACFRGQAATAAALVAQGADVNHRGDLSNTALHAAASAGSLLLCRLLLYHGASPAARNAYGNTPAALAATPACRALLTRPDVAALRAQMDAAAVAEAARREREEAEAADRLRRLREEEERQRRAEEEAARLEAEAAEAARLAEEAEARRAAQAEAARLASEQAEAERVAAEAAAAVAAAAAKKKKSGGKAAVAVGRRARAGLLGKPGSANWAGSAAAPSGPRASSASPARPSRSSHGAASGGSRPASCSTSPVATA